MVPRSWLCPSNVRMACATILAKSLASFSRAWVLADALQVPFRGGDGLLGIVVYRTHERQVGPEASGLLLGTRVLGLATDLGVALLGLLPVQLPKRCTHLHSHALHAASVHGSRPIQHVTDAQQDAVGVFLLAERRLDFELQVRHPGEVHIRM